MCTSNLPNTSIYTYSPKNPSSPPRPKDTKENSATGNEPRYPIYGKKYKPVAKKVKLIIGALPAQFRIVRNITGDPLADMPTLLTNPTEFTLTGRYTAECKEAVDKQHEGDFLWDEGKKLMHHFMSVQNEVFAWDNTKCGKFKEEYFPPVEIPTVPHEPWIQKNIPIPPGIYEDICEQIRTKIWAGVYEPSNSSYRSRWFCVVKDSRLRVVHSLELLNKVTIQHSGVTPTPDHLAEDFTCRACGATLNLYVSYDERILAESSGDLTTFQMPFGTL